MLQEGVGATDRRLRMKEVFIDFDGTISPEHGFNKEPEADVIDTINELYDSGECTIVIYSCRANPEICDPSDVAKMEQYLSLHGIKYHRVEPNKPHFHVIIDDRSFNPTLVSWTRIRDLILN